MNKAQLAFLEQLGERIPRLFDAIARGNVKSEFIVGVRTINSRQVRLKLVAEVVDPGSNPLATHGQARPPGVGTPRSSKASEIDIAEDASGATLGIPCPAAPVAGEVSQPPAGTRRTRRR